MRTIVLSEDKQERERAAVKIVSRRDRLNDPFIANWILEAVAGGSLADPWMIEKAKIILAERADGIWRTGRYHGDQRIKKVLRQKRKPPAGPGYVYLVRADNGLYKIGKAKDVEDRFKTFGSTCACKLELIHTVYSDKPHDLERRLHNRYAEKRSHGEWFALTDSDVKEITQSI